MSHTVSNHHEEVQALKVCIAQVRATGSRRQFPEPVKARVLALRGAGWPVKRLASELGLAGSQIYDWEKKCQDAVPPRVIHVEPPAPGPAGLAVSSQGPLQLRLGAFCITIAVAEGM